MSINRHELITKIHQLQGLDDSEKSALIELLRTQKKYGLVWEDKPEDVEERLREELPVLTEVKDRAIISDDPDAPDHILIEGDNLEALTALSYTHAGKIDVIYIDPPYNTGNKDFVYNDSFVDSEDSFRHSKWLSFMSKRLRIAKQLLSDKGVIFISIDDNEQAQLKLLCDEIFGQEYYLGLITRKQSSGAKNDTGENRIITTADYILSYAKGRFAFKPYFVKNQKTYTREDSEGKFSPRALEMQGGGDTLPARPRMGYSIYYRQSDNSVKLLFDYDLTHTPVYNDPDEKLLAEGYECFRPRKRDMALGRWRWGDGTFMEMFKNNLVHFEKGRVFIKERSKDNIPKYPEAIWDDYLNTLGTNELKDILGGKSFNFPKPSSLIAQLLRVTDSVTILDFFAGSGTTLHATMQLNAEDGGHRKCILVTNNENGICENVTYERNKRVINGYTTPKGVQVEGLKGNSLRYFKTEFVDRALTHQNKKAIFTSLVDTLRIKENCFTAQTTFGSVSLYGKDRFLRYFEENGRRLLILFDSKIIPLIVKEIESLDLADNSLKIYIFADGSYPFTAEFEPVISKINLVAMPDAIISALRYVLPSQTDTAIDETSLSPDELTSELQAATDAENQEQNQTGMPL